MCANSSKAHLTLNKALTLKRTSQVLAQHPAMGLTMTNMRLDSMRAQKTFHSQPRRAFAEGGGPEESGSGASETPADPQMANQPSYIKEMKS